MPCPRLLLCIFALLLRFVAVQASAAEQEDSPPPAFPLQVSDNHRYLVDRDKQPFLVVGDTPWSLIADLSADDIETYLDDRQARGFNALIVNLIEHKFSTDPPRTRAGLSPFNTP